MKNLLLVLFLTFGFYSARAQMTCESALYALQNYAHQVDYQYYQSYNWIAYNIHPYYQGQYVYNLNTWYQQQANYVNQQYYVIAQNCLIELMDNQASGYPHEDWEDEVEHPDAVDTKVAQTKISKKDAGKKVRIQIPDNPVGWQH